MDLQDPVPGAAFAIGIAHRIRILGTDTVQRLVAWDQGMGEFADDMARDLAAEAPARLRRSLLGEGIKRSAGDRGITPIVRLYLPEQARQIGDQPVLLRIAAQDIAFADIRFPGFEHRPQIDIDDVVGLDGPDRRIVARDGDTVGPCPHDAAVPMFLDPKLPRGQFADFVFDLALADSRAHQIFPLDGVEKPERLGLGAFQLGAARIFDKWKKAGHDGIGASRPCKINRKINHRMRAMKMMAALSALLLAGWVTQANAGPCPCTNFFTGDAKPFIAEGVAHDTVSGRFFVAGVAARRIIAIQTGRARNFARLPDEYSPLGIALADGSLWVTAAVLPQGAGHEGPSALIAFDLGGKVRTVYPVPDDGRHVLNDLTFAPDGTVYTSDARDGSLYRLMPGASALTRLGPRALLKSPQGMAVSRDGKFLLVADYSLGLVKVDPAAAAFEPLKIPADAKTKGIDGLARLADGSFLASQNGLAEPRILRLILSPDWSQLLSLEVVAEDDAAIADPSLVMTDSSGAYVVGVSQWASFGQDRQTPTKPLQPWRIIRLDIHSNAPGHQ